MHLFYQILIGRTNAGVTFIRMNKFWGGKGHGCTPIYYLFQWWGYIVRNNINHELNNIHGSVVRRNNHMV